MAAADVNSWGRAAIWLKLTPHAGLTILRRRIKRSHQRGAATRCRCRALQPPTLARPPTSALLGNRLTVDPRTLTPLVLVRIQVPQPNRLQKSLKSAEFRSFGTPASHAESALPNWCPQLMPTGGVHPPGADGARADGTAKAPSRKPRPQRTDLLLAGAHPGEETVEFVRDQDRHVSSTGKTSTSIATGRHCPRPLERTTQA